MTCLFQAPFGFRREWDAVASDEFEQSQNDAGRAFELRGRPEEDAFVRDREICVREA